MNKKIIIILVCLFLIFAISQMVTVTPSDKEGIQIVLPTKEPKKDMDKEEVIKSITPEPKEFKIEVVSTTVKSYKATQGTRYVYYFDIKNNGELKYKGDIYLKLYAEDGTLITGGKLDMGMDVEPHRAISRTFETYNAPKGLQQLGVATFEYRAVRYSIEVSKGKGNIETKEVSE